MESNVDNTFLVLVNQALRVPDAKPPAIYTCDAWVTNFVA